VGLFYRVFMPAAVITNLGLGLVVLATLRPYGWLGDVEVVTGAFCCAVAGWLAATAWMKSYWGGAMARQAKAWMVMVDAILGWLEDTPLPTGALNRLQVTIDRAATQARSTAS
jgi:hypothetical protein